MSASYSNLPFQLTTMWYKEDRQTNSPRGSKQQKVMRHYVAVHLYGCLFIHGSKKCKQWVLKMAICYRNPSVIPQSLHIGRQATLTSSFLYLRIWCQVALLNKLPNLLWTRQVVLQCATSLSQFNAVCCNGVCLFHSNKYYTITLLSINFKSSNLIGFTQITVVFLYGVCPVGS